MSGGFSRRSVLGGAGALGLLGPHLAFASTGRADLAERPLVFVILRGGLDGLAAVAPVGERRYDELRGPLALSPAGEEDGVLDIGEGFGLHPSLAGLHSLYQQGDAAVVHAVASPYRQRSHFDAQDLLESGGEAVYEMSDGWLNRALQVLDSPPDALAVGAALPFVLRGDAAASTWSPNILADADEDTIARLMDLYASDPQLGPALASAIEIDMVAGDMRGGRGRGAAAAAEAMRAAGRLINGGAATLTVVSMSGWDTHSNQGTSGGQLAMRLTALDAALLALKDELGERWATTAVVVATEFGRTAAANGTRGTDHGTGGAAFLLGGAMNGGHIHGDWPGLDRLHQDRDLIPANDMRGLFKGVLRDHWGVDRADLDARVFPGTGGVAPIGGLIA